MDEKSGGIEMVSVPDHTKRHAEACLKFDGELLEKNDETDSHQWHEDVSLLMVPQKSDNKSTY